MTVTNNNKGEGRAGGSTDQSDDRITDRPGQDEGGETDDGTAAVTTAFRAGGQCSGSYGDC